MTDLEKASFVLLAKHNTPSEEVGGMLYVNVTEQLSVAIDRAQIEDLAERYDDEYGWDILCIQ